MSKARLVPWARSTLLAALALAVIVAIVAALNRPAPPVLPAVLVTPVVTAPVRRGPIERTVPLVGMIRAGTETQLAARTPARVLSVPVREGNRVSRGELLVQLDDRDARAALAAAAAGVQAAEAVLGKAQSGAVVRGSEIESGIATAEASVVAARTRLVQARGTARAAAEEAAAELRRAQAGLESAQATRDAAIRGGRPAQQSQAEAAVRQAEAAAQAAHRSREEAQFLYDRGGLTRAQLDEARVAEQTAQAQLASARAALDLAREGASPEERRAAEAAVRQAQAGVEVARAGERRARLAREDVSAAEAQLRQAEAGLRTARAGRAGRSAARQDTRAAAAALAQARVQWQQAQEQVAATRLLSPVDGVVTLRAVEPGQIAQPGQPLVTVASGALFLDAPVTSLVADALRPGQPIDVQSDAAPGRTFRAIIHDVPSVPGPDGRTYTVRAALRGGGAEPTNSPPRPVAPSPRRPVPLSPGVRAKGVVRVARATGALLVPPAAVQRTAVGPVVWVARNGKAERRPVSIGIETDTAVQITSGLSAREAVIVSGAEALHPGDAVDVGGRGGERGQGSGASVPVSFLFPGVERPWA